MELKQEQKRIIEHDIGNMLVSASAGSGKTFVMIERIARLLIENKARISEILAVTFTEAAAKEMKEKLAERLSDAVIDGGVEVAADIVDLPYADVCTIDSFCMRLIRTYFYKLGLAPDFSVADESVSERLKEDAMDLTFKKSYERGDEKFLRVASQYAAKRTDRELKNILFSAYDFISTETDPQALKSRNLAVYDEKNYSELAENVFTGYKKTVEFSRARVAEITKALKAKGLTSGAATAEKLFRDMNVFVAADTPYALTAYEKGRFNFERKLDDVSSSLKEELKGYKSEFEEILSFVSLYFTDESSDMERLGRLKEDTEVIYSLIDLFGETYAELKRDENVLDFNDLEQFALKLLKDEEIAADVKSRYKYVFIDEYQDVNGLQEEIISKVADGNLFMVGDVKQSIYEFRGCRPDYFERKFNDMQARGEKVERLNCNFRSSDAVIDTVNAVFSYSMTKENYGEDYSSSAMLVTSGNYGERKGRGRVFKFVPEGRKQDKPLRRGIYDVIRDTAEKDKTVSDEALLLAYVIKDELKNTYFDCKSGEEKKVEYKDIAVLTREKNSEKMRDIMQGLVSLNIPISATVTEQTLDHAEITVLTSYLKLLDNFNDDYALATVMKSPIANFSEEELALIALSFYDGVADVERSFVNAVKHAALTGDLAEKRDGFLEYIAGERYLSDFCSAGEILKKVVADSNYEAYLLASENGRQKAERLKFFIQKAASREYALKEFVELIEKTPKFFERECGGEENAVNIVSIHASKGLEYPVVIMRDLNKGFNFGDSAKRVLFDRDLGFAVKYYDEKKRLIYDTLFTGFVKNRINMHVVKEELRLFYVALTRAKYSLNALIIGDKSKNDLLNAKTYFDFMPPDFNIFTVGAEQLNIIGGEKSARKVMLSSADENETLRMKEDFSFLYPYSAETNLPLKISVTASLKSETENAPVYVLADEESGSSAEQGNTAHKIMEYYDFDEFADVQVVVDRLIERGIIAPSEVKGVNIGRISAAICSGKLDFIKGKKTYREKNFIVSVPGIKVIGAPTDAKVVLQGKIDLLVVDGGDAYVIDYKYSAHGEDTLKARYSKQLDLYAYAVEKTLDLKVRGKYIVSLLTGEVITL